MPDLAIAPRRIRRHDLLRVAPDVWPTVLDGHPDLAALPLVGDWAKRGWPVIVRRMTDGDDPASVPIGMPLPPDAGKLRIALSVAAAGIIDHAPPLALRIAKAAAPASWLPTITALIALGAEHGIAPQTFGSLLWQHQTGLIYLSATSDLDLLWPVPDGCDVRGLLETIAGAEHAAPMRIDGELLFPDGSAVHWRELRTAIREEKDGTVLVKTHEGVRLVSADSLVHGRAA